MWEQLAWSGLAAGAADNSNQSLDRISQHANPSGASTYSANLGTYRTLQPHPFPSVIVSCNFVISNGRPSRHFMRLMSNILFWAAKILCRCPECNEDYEKNFISNTIRGSCVLMWSWTLQASKMTDRYTSWRLSWSFQEQYRRAVNLSFKNNPGFWYEPTLLIVCTRIWMAEA